MITAVVLARRGVFSIRSLERSRGRSVSRLPGLAWLALGLGMYGLWMIASAVGGGIAASREGDLGELGVRAVVLWAGYLPVVAIGSAMLIAAGMRRGRIGRDLGASGWRLNVGDLWRGGGALLLTIPIYFVVALAASAVADRMRGESGDPITHDLLGRLVEAPTGPAWWAIVAAVVIAAPIVEEVIYRGCIQTGVAGLMRSRSAGVVLTAGIFAIAHAGAVRPEALAGLFVLGLAFGLAFERTGRLGAPIVMHAMFNGLNLALAMYTT